MASGRPFVNGLCGAAAAVAVSLAAIGSAGAQYRGVPYGYGYDYYDPYNAPVSRPYARGQGYGGAQGYGYGQGYGDGYGQARPAYGGPYGYGDDRQSIEPRDGSGGGVRGGGGFDLGTNAARSTRQEVRNGTNQPPGTIVIDTASRHLYYTEANGQALQYGIGVGRQGFAWHGVAKVQRKAEWPDWVPPSDMLKRRPDLPARMTGGIENPLGARALYLFQGNHDTLFRIHGTNEPDTIGKAVSSGCIRMMNADVIDLYGRVPVGTRVVVL